MRTNKRVTMPRPAFNAYGGVPRYAGSGGCYDLDYTAPVNADSSF